MRPANFSGTKGVRCVGCKAPGGVRVIDTRILKAEEVVADFTMRSRKCLLCGSRWKTKEIHESFFKHMKTMFTQLKRRETRRAKRKKIVAAADINQLRKTVSKIEGRAR